MLARVFKLGLLLDLVMDSIKALLLLRHFLLHRNELSLYFGLFASQAIKFVFFLDFITLLGRHLFLLF